MLVYPMTVLAALLHRHDARAWMIGSLMAVEGVGLVVPQFLGIYMFRSWRKRKINLMLWHWIMIVPIFFIMAAAVYWSQVLGSPAVRWSLWWSLAIQSLAMGVTIAVWQEWTAHLYNRTVRGMVVGMITAGASLAASLSALIAGGVLRVLPGDEGYALLYVVGGVTCSLAIFVFLLIRDPAESETETGHLLPRPVLLRLFFRSLSEPNFRNYLAGRILATFGFSVLPFIIIYYQSGQGGGLNYGQVISFSAVSWIAQSATAIVVGRMGDRRGHRLGALLGASMPIVTLLVLILSHGPGGCIAAYVGAGICLGAVGLSHYNLLIETCPHDSYAAHITVANLVMMPATLLAPLLAGLLVEWTGIMIMFKVSLTVSVVALLWLILRFKEPRALPIFEDTADSP